MQRRLIAVFLLLVGALTGSAAMADWRPEPHAGGVPVAVGPEVQRYPAVVEDGAGGAFVAWSYDEVYVQHLDADGEPLWTANGVAATSGAAPDRLTLVPDGAGGVIILWLENQSLSLILYGQRMNAAGIPQWAAGGVALTGGPPPLGSIVRELLRAIPDEAGGAIFCWQQYTVDRFGQESLPSVRAQRTDGTGARLWGTNGIGLSTGTGGQTHPELVSDLAGGAIIVWSEYRFGGVNIFIQRFNPTGTALWTADGVFCSGNTGGLDPAIAPDGSGGAILAWEVVSGNIYARRVDAAGTVHWGSIAAVPVCLASGIQGDPVLVSDGAGGAMMAWNDGRDTPSLRIYAQHVDSLGAPLWTTNGIGLTFGSNSQSNPRMSADGTGGAFVVWNNSWIGLSPDIYATRVEGTGVQHPPNGTPVSTEVDSQSEYAIVADGRGGTIMAWQDSRSGNADIYAQRIGPYGYLGDPAPRITSVKDIPNDQGRWVKLSWSAGYLDTEFAPSTFNYMIWRLVSPGYWEILATMSAGPLPEYSMAVLTLADSGGVNTYTSFKVEARWDYAGGPTWMSQPDSGYSLDNLVPLTPAFLQGSYSDGTSTLTWNANTEADLAGYRVYRGTSANFLGTPENMVGEPLVPIYVDHTGVPYVYLVTSMDRNGNESPPTVWVPRALSELPNGTAPRMGLPSPNPARSATTLEFNLNQETTVTLTICDVSGRLVRETSEHFNGGTQRVQWDLRDRSGVRVAPGAYFARLSTQAGLLGTRTLVVVP